MSFEDMLRTELQDAGATVPVKPLRFDETLARGKRARRNALVVSFTAAAVTVAVVLGGGAALTGGDLGWLPPRPAATPTPDERKDARRDVNPEEVEQALRSWLRAIQSSDEDAAWGLMTPAAQTEIGRDRFDQMMGSALPEGLGAFADARQFHLVGVSSGDEQAQVVAVVAGRVSREGVTEFAATAVPMRVADGEVLVDGGIINPYRERNATFASESLGPQVYEKGDELSVSFGDPGEIIDASIALDDGRFPLHSRFDPDTGTVRSKLQRDLAAGPHVATVIVQHRSGRLYAEAIIFRAAPA
ncbi:MAG: hypothetical protein ACRDJ5_01255 [Actinomycetota bacterium]